MMKNSEMSPAEVLEQRVAAHGAGDFRLVYNSTHSASAFRANFSSLDEYLDYARDHLVGQMRIEKFATDSVTDDGSSALVAARAKYVANHEVSFVFEMHELQREDGCWRLVASCRLAVAEKDYRETQIRSEMFSGQPWF